MTIEERIAFTGYKVNTQFSASPNEDRVKISRLLKGREREQIASPSHLIEVYNELKDYRMSAFVCGVTILSVKQAVAGDLFPDGMRFSTIYLSELSGDSVESVRTARKGVLRGRGRGENRLCTREEAYKILAWLEYSRGQPRGHRSPKGGVTDRKYVADTFGVSTTTAANLLSLVGIKIISKGVSYYYDKDKVDIFIDSVFTSTKSTVISYAAEIYGVKEDTYSNLPGSFMLSDKTHQSRLLTKNYKAIVDASYKKGMNWTEFGMAISVSMEEEYKKIVSRIQKQGN